MLSYLDDEKQKALKDWLNSKNDLTEGDIFSYTLNKDKTKSTLQITKIEKDKVYFKVTKEGATTSSNVSADLQDFLMAVGYKYFKVGTAPKATAEAATEKSAEKAAASESTFKVFDTSLRNPLKSIFTEDELNTIEATLEQEANEVIKRLSELREMSVSVNGDEKEKILNRLQAYMTFVVSNNSFMTPEQVKKTILNMVWDSKDTDEQKTDKLKNIDVLCLQMSDTAIDEIFEITTSGDLAVKC